MYKGLAALDFDGTIFPHRGEIAETTQRALFRLAETGICCAVVTGRSLHSFLKSVPGNMPLDYLVFSSGAGILRWRDKKLLTATSLDLNDIRKIIPLLKEGGMDFMLQKAIPDNHHFYYYQHNRQNRDFSNRIALYSDTAQPLDERNLPPKASQFLAVLPHPIPISMEIRNRLSEYSIIRATSPLDGQSIWMEIFPQSVNKGKGAQWLQSYLGLEGAPVLGVGNDYNDIDLLTWVQTPFVVSGAPEELKASFTVTGSCEEGGVGMAIEFWLKEKFPAGL